MTGQQIPAADVPPDSDVQQYRRVFLPLWVAMVALQSGLLIHDVGAAWLISLSTDSRSLVAVVQTASSLPFFLFALPAGALADMVDRRRIVQTVAAGLAVLSLLVAIVSAAGYITIPILLLASFVIGCGNAAFSPSWQAMTPELVGGSRLQDAFALNSLGINIARSIGPLLSGLLIFVGGPTAAFSFNTLLYAAVALAFVVVAPAGPAVAAQESLLTAIRGGLAYARYDRGLQRVAFRAFPFFFFASTFWALVPVVVRDRFQGTSIMLGAMVGAVGLGAIAAVVVLKWFRRRYDLDQLMLGAGLLTALAIACVPEVSSPLVLGALHVVLGFCWLLSFSSIHMAAQLRLTPWIRARGTAIYLIAVFGALAIGSLASGVAADQVGLSGAFWLSAAGLLIASIVATRLRIAIAAPVTLARSAILPDATSVTNVAVAVTVTYAPRDDQMSAALRLLARLRTARRRTGARSTAGRAAGALLIESIGYDSGLGLDLSARRHTVDDVADEVALLALLKRPPQVATAPASHV